MSLKNEIKDWATLIAGGGILILLALFITGVGPGIVAGSVVAWILYTSGFSTISSLVIGTIIGLLLAVAWYRQYLLFLRSFSR